MRKTIQFSLLLILLPAALLAQGQAPAQPAQQPQAAPAPAQPAVQLPKESPAPAAGAGAGFPGLGSGMLRCSLTSRAR